MLICLVPSPAWSQDSTEMHGFTVVETTAEFPGGMGNFYKYISENLVYPKDAKKMKAKGVVLVEFIIDKDGFVPKDSVRVVPKEALQGFPGLHLKDAGTLPESCYVEAVRVIAGSPRWIPGRRRGISVQQKMVLPLRFGG